MPAANLTIEQIMERLEAVDDPKIVDDIYDFAAKQLVVEDAHTTRLDGRATSLFGAVGFSMTLAFSFGGWSLLDNTRKVPNGTTIAWAFTAALLLGLVTSLIALWALVLRKNLKSVQEEEIFHPEVVAAGKTQQDFRRHVAGHLWRIYQARFDMNERRALLILIGQIAFIVFLASILFLSIVTTLSAIKRQPDPPPPGPAVNCPAPVFNCPCCEPAIDAGAPEGRGGKG